MRFEGTLTTWNDDRGFGFITPTQGGQTLFVHIKDFPAGSGRPVVGQRLEFEVRSQPDGRKRAVALQYPQRSRRPVKRQDPGTAAWTWPRRLAIPVFGLVVVATGLRWGLWPWWWAPYLVLSVLTAISYAGDKWAAEEGRWRTPENTLHGLALMGGWPGALLAQQTWRHKTSKPSFVAAFWVSVGGNVLGFAGFHAAFPPP